MIKGDYVGGSDWIEYVMARTHQDITRMWQWNILTDDEKRHFWLSLENIRPRKMTKDKAWKWLQKYFFKYLSATVNSRCIFTKEVD